MEIIRSERTVKVLRETDVLVVGGGPAGIGAAVGVARQGCRVLLLEKKGFLGGNITGAYVESSAPFLRLTNFKTCGVYAQMEKGYQELHGRSHDIRPNPTYRFSSEYLKIYLDGFVRQAGVEVLLHSFVNDCVVKDGKIEAAIIQTKQGPAAVKAKLYIDCTGDGDLAFAAGVPFEQGRDGDHLCQPGTLAFRISGINAAMMTANGEDHLREVSRAFKEAYRAGKTGLDCKRQDLPFGRLTVGGEISYVNYPCAYGVDSTSVEDMTRAEMECREYIVQMLDYMRTHFAGFENVELSSIATEVSFRDSRRIIGRHHLTIEEMESRRQFRDVISVWPRFYDMLAPDGNMDGDGSVEGKGFRGHIYVSPSDGRSFQVPYASLLPENIDNLLVAGRCISCDHVAQSGIRAVALCTQTGEAAGTAASLSLKEGVLPCDVNIGAVQDVLRAQGFVLE